MFGDTVAYGVSVKWSVRLEDHEPSQTGAEFQSYGMSLAQEGMRCEGGFDTRRSLSEENLHRLVTVPGLGLAKCRGACGWRSEMK